MEESCAMGGGGMAAFSSNVTYTGVVCSLIIGGGNASGATMRSSAASTAGASSGRVFFNTYYSTTRFVVGTVLSALAAASNGLMGVGVWAIGRGQSSTSSSNIRLMFVHMAATNVLCCATLWLSDNLLFLFGRQIARLVIAGRGGGSSEGGRGDLCRFLAYPIGAIFIGSSFGVMSKLSMAGFCCVQYVSVCRPLRHRKERVRRKLVLFLVLSWIASLFVGSLPSIVLKVVTARNVRCQLWIRLTISNVLAYGSVIVGAFDVIVYGAIVLLCLGICRRMRVVRREISRFRFSRDARCEMKAIATVAAFMSALGLYCVSHIVLHVLSLTGFGGISLDSGALIYYMNLSPYVQLTLEPVVYGLRMHELHRVVKLCRVQLDRYLGIVHACYCGGTEGCRCSRKSRRRVAQPNAPLVMTSVNTGASPAQV